MELQALICASSPGSRSRCAAALSKYLLTCANIGMCSIVISVHVGCDRLKMQQPLDSNKLGFPLPSKQGNDDTDRARYYSHSRSARAHRHRCDRLSYSCLLYTSPSPRDGLLSR